MEEVNNPEHYNNMTMEVIDMMETIWGKEALILFCEMNSFKYRMRAGNKFDGSQDIKKAKWYDFKRKELI